jgi:hypothetical protein
MVILIEIGWVEHGPIVAKASRLAVFPESVHDLAS